MQKTTKAEPGDVLGGVEILSIKADDINLAAVVYEVRFLCCKRVDLLAHYSLRQRVLRHRKGCVACQRRGQKQMMQSLSDRPSPDYYPSVEIRDIDGRTRPWPTSIGKLGPRWESNAQIPVAQLND